ncbi:MAG: putative baseplate assembly protein [Pyrinomonadaceae bacterium]
MTKLLAAYAPETNWERQLAAPGPGAALVGIFSRFAEIVIRRLNKTPEKNLLAYLDLLGLSLLPPEPARAPLTFFLANGSLTDAHVPVGTEVAAKPAEGDAGPVVFETERELTVVAAQLDAAFTRDPARDAYDDRSLAIVAPSEPGLQSFRAETPIEHALYLSHAPFLSQPALKNLTVSFEVQRAFSLKKPPSLIWELWNGTLWMEILPKPAGANVTPGANGFVDDGTAALTKVGVNNVVLAGLPFVPPSEVGGRTGRWLRARLATPLPPADFRPTATPPAQLPTVGSVTLTALLERSLDAAGGAERLAVEAAFLNYAPVDASKSFFAFGEKPRVGDALYLAQSEAFSAAGTKVTLAINVTRPATDPATEQPYPTPVVKHAWEFWDGRRWATLFTSELKPDKTALVTDSTAPGRTSPADETQAFTKSGRVSFTFPAAPARAAVNGVENFWVRVRILSGDYGREAYYKFKKPEEYTLVPSSFAPPTIDALAVGYSLSKTEPPDAVVTSNDFDFETVRGGQSFKPFLTAEDTPVSFYLGFTLPGARLTFPNRVVSLYVGVDDRLLGRKPDSVAPASPPRLAWEYWNGSGWSKLTVFDGTSGLTRAGIIEFLGPPDFAPSLEFGRACYWVRVVLTSGVYAFMPRVRSLMLNTVTASQAVTVRDENLGSSDASANQKFLTTAAPILTGQRLEVREPDLPSSVERAEAEGREGLDAVSVTLDVSERPSEIWVRWHEVPDFYGSHGRDRHYVLNHLTGEVRFGDGLNGMIPPRGAGNLRLKFYRTGGGRAGNRTAGTITELKTTVPYIGSVVNREPAVGGAEAESRDSLIRRGPLAMRHRDRAVTAQDYEDIAMLASPEVARVKCVPLKDLSTMQAETGVVSLVVVPDSTEATPYPTLELLNTVRSYLDARRAAEVQLVLVGPEYVRVTVSAEVVPESPGAAGPLAEEIRVALSRYLHPLTGGTAGQGWGFGHKPHASDIYAVIESVAGVSYVRSLQLSGPKTPGGEESPLNFEKLPDGQDFFLVHSGEHQISLIFD